MGTGCLLPIGRTSKGPCQDLTRESPRSVSFRSLLGPSARTAFFIGQASRRDMRIWSQEIANWPDFLPDGKGGGGSQCKTAPRRGRNVGKCLHKVVMANRVDDCHGAGRLRTQRMRWSAPKMHVPRISATLAAKHPPDRKTASIAEPGQPQIEPRSGIAAWSVGPPW